MGVEVQINGVRKTAVAAKTADGLLERTRPSSQSLRECVHVVSDPQNLDSSVEEVFGLMLGVACSRTNRPIRDQAESVTAVVGFGGILSGACVLRCDAGDARVAATQMTGLEFSEVDNTVKDAIGEICNMLAGAWKGKVPQLAEHCGLSVPAVITGRDYFLHVQAPEFQLQHDYASPLMAFEVMIVCDNLL
jgi:chemotaxis protein CheX